MKFREAFLKNGGKELRIQGVAISEGIGIGFSHFLPSSDQEVPVPEFPIALSEVDNEIERYRKALFSSKEDLLKLQENLAEDGSNEAISLIDAHIHMLEDPMITTDMEQKIRQMLQNTESVFRGVIKDFEQRFISRADSFFEQRLVDVTDLSTRILNHLRQNQQQSISGIPTGSVVFTKELAPFHAAAAHSLKVSAFVSQIGGGNSHAALIAKSKGIPYICNVDISIFEKLPSVCVIVDGMKGEIIFNPEPETLSKYRRLQNQMFTRYQTLEHENNFKVETIDGYPVELYANVNHLKDLDDFPLSISGIGLLRSEHLFFQKKQNVFPTEEEQFQAYLSLMKKVKGRPIIFRFFDIGGDKFSDLLNMKEKEPNPMLGCRGIRFLLKNEQIFKTQIKALLRLAHYAPMYLLIPLVSDLNEIIQTKQIIEEVKHDLAKENWELRFPIQLGSMIEVPSTVLICEGVAQESDFLSIGTNDLIQYTLGVDRSNPSVNDLYYSVHPSIIRMIKMIAYASETQSKSLLICGGIASNPQIIPLLIGLGIRKFSCSIRYVQVIKRAIRKTSVLKAFYLAEQALKCTNPSTILELLSETTTQHTP